MRKISWWARNNPGKSRSSIIIIHLVNTALGIVAGRTLEDLGMQVPGILLGITMGLFIMGAFYYPHKSKRTANYYKRQKWCDWMLAFSTFTVCCFVSNAHGSFVLSPTIPQGAAVAIVNPVAPKKDKSSKVSLTPTRAERKALLKELKKLLRQSFRKRQDDRENRASRITLVILTIVGGVVLSALLAALACNVACSGSETGAILIIAFGAAAIAGLMILIIKAIHRRYPPVPGPEPPGVIESPGNNGR